MRTSRGIARCSALGPDLLARGAGPGRGGAAAARASPPCRWARRCSISGRRRGSATSSSRRRSSWSGWIRGRRCAPSRTTSCVRVLARAARLLAANTGGGRRVTTGRRSPGEALWVYLRTGRPCRRCGTPHRAPAAREHRLARPTGARHASRPGIGPSSHHGHRRRTRHGAFRPPARWSPHSTRMASNPGLRTSRSRAISSRTVCGRPRRPIVVRQVEDHDLPVHVEDREQCRISPGSLVEQHAVVRAFAAAPGCGNSLSSHSLKSASSGTWSVIVLPGVAVLG